MDANERRLVEEVLNRIKLERLGQPYALISPKPYHFPQYSKAETFTAVSGWANDPQLELLYSWGMPRDVMHASACIPGNDFDDEFADFTIELFGLKGEPLQESDLDPPARRQVGRVRYANVNSASIAMKAGLQFYVRDENGKELTVLAWRWRVFMNDSSLCLENLWHGLSGWVPFVLGIKYDNPEKMVADLARFAPALKLCNLLDAELGERRGGDRRPKWKRDLWSEDMLKRYALLVKKLATDWEWIKGTYEPYTPDSSKWLEEIFTMPMFNAMLQAYPKLTRELLLRIADNDLNPRDREPIGLACVHAAHELSIEVIYGENNESLPPAKTLREYYEKGLKLLP